MKNFYHSLKLFLTFCCFSIFFTKSQAQVDNNIIARRLLDSHLNQLGMTKTDFNNTLISDSYLDKITGAQLVYAQQSFKDIPVFNQIQVLAFKNGELVSQSGKRLKSMEKLAGSLSGLPEISAVDAVKIALRDRKINTSAQPVVISSEQNGRFIRFDNMGVSHESISAQLMWVPLNEGKNIVLAWQIYIVPTNSSDYWLVRVNAMNQEIVGVNDLTVYCNWDDPTKKLLPNYESADHQTPSVISSVFDFAQITSQPENISPNVINNAAYRVIPFPAESPIHPGGTHALVNNPWEAAPGDATSLKWHNNGTADFNITRGNNVFSQEDRNADNVPGAPAPSITTTDPLNFDYTPNFTVTPTQTSPNRNQQFAITNLFYWNNIIHDISYQYGFDEVSGNFQASNQGRGGLGNDYVIADAQDGSGTNNANFATPADGSSGRMQMYLWSGNPQKDGDLDNGVITHEFAHGISNRLTGGPSQSACLQNNEQMGEGWSDYFGLMYTQNWTTATLNTGFSSPRPVGNYAAGQTVNGAGIRTRKYCTNFAVNNLTMGTSIDAESHNRGELWCATLWDMTWNIINQVGSINTNIYNPNGTGGNSIALKLVMTGMKLQPCSPGFIDGRDAILQADQLLYNGAYSCAIREAFRRRGMGALASQGSSASVTDQTPDFTLASAKVELSQSGPEVTEGNEVTYFNKVTAGPCAAVTNFLLTDTLPSNVTYVSGGTYNASNRVVSFPINLTAGQTEVYSFTVKANVGSYYPTVNLFEDNVTGTSIPATWTATTTSAGVWSVSSTRSTSAPNSYFSQNLDVQSDQQLTLVNPISLGSNPPPLIFKHFYNMESTYDGGVLEISTNNGTTWSDVQNNILVGGYNDLMDATTLLNGRRAWTGSTGGKFIKTKINLQPYANQNVKIRFRMTSDVGTNFEGWYVDDIAFKDQAMIEIKSNLFNNTGTKVGVTDTFTIINQAPSCIAASVSTQPANVNACIGNDANFNVTVAGTNPVYQWQQSTNGGASFTNISGATSATLTIAGVNASMNNNRYRVLITNECPSSVTSQVVVLSVNTPAVVNTQPLAQTVCQGQTANFSASVAGSSNTYQWQISTDGGNTFTNISGANSSSLSILNSTALMNNSIYHLVVTGCNPNPVTTSNVTLTVNSPSGITTQPAATSACPGSNAQFSITASGTAIQYQWQVSTNGGATFNDIPGETNPQLNLTAVNSTMSGNQYQVIVTSTACPNTVTSAPATLTVNNSVLIAIQPVDNSACPGSSITYSVDASGTGLTYQWQVSTNGGTSFTDISGQTNATLTLSNIMAAMEGNLYHVLVSSACSSTPVISNNVILHVYTPAAIVTQPASVTVCQNSTATFTVTSNLAGNTYQWQVSTDGGVNYADITGEINSSLLLPAVTSSMNNNQYRVVVTGTQCGFINSNAAILSVSAPVNISAQPANIAACLGNTATLSLSATGTSLSYQWQMSTDNGASFSNIAGAVANTLSITASALTMNNNQYRAVVTEQTCGAVNSAVATLTVNPLPVVTISASPSNVLFAGEIATISINGATGGVISWSLNNSPISGQTGSSINVTHTEMGIYAATVTDANGCKGTSNEIMIRDTTRSSSFIFPNPSRGSFQVRMDENIVGPTLRKVELYDNKGARILIRSFVVNSPNEVVTISINQLTGGVYMVQILDGTGHPVKEGKVMIK